MDVVRLVEVSILVGLLYCPFTIAMGLNFRVLNYPDLSLEGSAVFGGAVSFMALNAGLGPLISIAVGAVGGALAGLVTAGQHLYLGVSKLLSGIITAAILYSLNIRLLGGRANARFGDLAGLFDRLNPQGERVIDLIVLGLLACAILVTASLVFSTRLGLLLRTLGDNERYLVSLGENPKAVTLWGLALSNGIVGFGGAVLVQQKRICDVNLSFGLLVAALAGMVLGESLLPARGMARYVLSNVLGTMVYNLAIAFVLFNWSSKWEALIMSSDVRLVSGLLLLIPTVLSIRRKAQRRLFRSEW